MGESKDQKDILAENAKLTEQLTAVNTRLTTAEASITSLRTERDEARTSLTKANEQLTTADTNIKTLTKERDDARTENARLTESQKDFDAKLSKETATKLAEHGINPEAVKKPAKTTEQTQGADGKPNWTAKAQEALNGKKPVIPVK